MLEAGVRFVSVLILNVETEDFDALAREASLLVRRKVLAIDGLVEAIVLGNPEKTQLLIVSQWGTSENWAAAQWDEDVGRSMADFFESSTSIEIRSYEPIAIVHGAQR